MELVSPSVYQHQVWKNRLWGGGKCPLCPKPCGSMLSPAPQAPWGGQGATPQLTHVWVMLVLLWKAFTSRDPRMAETCSKGSRRALGEGSTAPARGEAEGRCGHCGQAPGAALAFRSRAGDLAHGHSHSRHHVAGTASLWPCGSAGSPGIPCEGGARRHGQPKPPCCLVCGCIPFPKPTPSSDLQCR